MTPARREPMIRAIDAPASWADWDDGRADCGLCLARTGHYCTALGEPHRRPWAHPVGLRHWCSEFRERGKR